mmetsp:Transcript_71647/g.167780  ORF Transcript_71647/g.167780 Transcript_71647/m.167780 type:complete len:225 (+) Transcript_71647:309-983(+)
MIGLSGVSLHLAAIRLIASEKKNSPAKVPPRKWEQALLAKSLSPHSPAASDIMVQTMASSFSIPEAHRAQRFSRNPSRFTFSWKNSPVQSQSNSKGLPTRDWQQARSLPHSLRMRPAASAAPAKAAKPKDMVRPHLASLLTFMLGEQCCAASLALAAAMAKVRAEEAESCAQRALMRSFSVSVNLRISSGSSAPRHPKFAAFQVLKPEAAMYPAEPSTSPTQEP